MYLCPWWYWIIWKKMNLEGVSCVNNKWVNFNGSTDKASRSNIMMPLSFLWIHTYCTTQEATVERIDDIVCDLCALYLRFAGDVLAKLHKAQGYHYLIRDDGASPLPTDVAVISGNNALYNFLGQVSWDLSAICIKQSATFYVQMFSCDFNMHINRVIHEVLGRQYIVGDNY